jgi:hypothetical protein
MTKKAQRLIEDCELLRDHIVIKSQTLSPVNIGKPVWIFGKHRYRVETMGTHIDGSLLMIILRWSRLIYGIEYSYKHTSGDLRYMLTGQKVEELRKECRYDD